MTLGEHRLAPALPRFVVLYAILYAGFGVASPFLPPFLESRGLAADQIGFVLATGTAARLLAGPIAGRIADRWHALRTTFAVCTICAATFAVANLAAHTPWTLLLMTVLWSAALAPAAPLAAALTLAAAEPLHHKRRFEYGWVRGAGSAAFIVATVGSGQAVDTFGLGPLWCYRRCFSCSLEHALAWSRTIWQHASLRVHPATSEASQVLGTCCALCRSAV
jgi:PPP family 3-phenylpropionic acid transporter